MELRHPNSAEVETVHSFVQTVVDEVYAEALSLHSVPIGTTDWLPAWIAVVQDEIVGIALTVEESVEDLWVAAIARGRGIGKALLSRCEAEVKERGFPCAKLRVVSSNLRALNFYEAQGWTAERTYPHENLPVNMTDLIKAL